VSHFCINFTIRTLKNTLYVMYAKVNLYVNSYDFNKVFSLIHDFTLGTSRLMTS
jgi:hypothetical protein